METTLTGLAAALAAAAAAAPIEAAAVVAKGLLNIKNGARRNAQASSGTHAKAYPGTITYDPDPDLLGGEVGPERRGQGHLGPILEYGSVNNAPHRDLGRALDDEEPRFIDAAAAIGSKWL